MPRPRPAVVWLCSAVVSAAMLPAQAADAPLRNLVPNGDFEAPATPKGKTPTGWQKPFAWPGRLEVVPQTRPGSPGKQLLNIQATSKQSSGGVFTPKIPLDPTKVLQVSGWLKAGGPHTHAGAYFGVSWFDADRKPIIMRKGTRLNYTYVSGAYRKPDWRFCEKTFLPCFGGPKESYAGNDIPPNAAFFDIRIFALEYPQEVCFDDIFATQDIAQSDWIVGWQGTRHAVKAARDMAEIMTRVLGVTVVAGPWRGYRAKHTLVITDAAHAPPDMAARLKGKRLDAFAIKYPARLHGRDVCLLVARDEQACDLAAYYFLTRFLGVEWVGPGELGEVLTKQPDWRMPAAIDVVESPDYEHRYWASPAMNARRWLAGSFRLQFHHNFRQVFDPKQFGDRPDLYPFYGGKRHVPDVKRAGSGWQPCTGNPEAVRIATDYGIKYLAEHPGHKSFSLSVNDGGSGICLCEKCRAQDSKIAFDSGQPFLTDRFFRFNNAVIDRVLKVNPQAYVAALGYGRCKRPPAEVRVNPRVLVFTVCDNTNPQPDMAQRQRDWKATGATPCIYQWLWDCGFLTVRHYPHALRDIVRLSHELGGFGYYCEAMTNWAAGGPKFYVLARVLWDTDADVDALLDRYMRLAYGAAAGAHVGAYFARWEQVWERFGRAVRYNTGQFWRSAAQLKHVTRQDLAFLDRALQHAKASPMTPKQQKRFEYVETYYRWLRINADQDLVARELADDAWVAKQSPEAVLVAAERGMALTRPFEAMWHSTIATDTTGWLLSVRYRNNAKECWDRLIAPIRQGVERAYEPAIDRALDGVTERLLKTRAKPAAIATWQEQVKRHPKLTQWAKTQVHLLTHGPGENLAPNPGFEQGAPGNPPQITSWAQIGAYQGLPADYAWQANSGRDGGHAATVGRGYIASIRATIPTKRSRRYRVSVWYKTSGPRTRVNGRIGAVPLPLEPTDGAWRRAATTFTSPHDGLPLTLAAYGQDKGQWTWFDDVEVREILAP